MMARSRGYEARNQPNHESHWHRESEGEFRTCDDATGGHGLICNLDCIPLRVACFFMTSCEPRIEASTAITALNHFLSFQTRRTIVLDVSLSADAFDF